MLYPPSIFSNILKLIGASMLGGVGGCIVSSSALSFKSLQSKRLFSCQIVIQSKIWYFSVSELPFFHKEESIKKYVGVPGMNSIPKALCTRPGSI